jgi:hypothetical protein
MPHKDYGFSMNFGIILWTVGEQWCESNEGIGWFGPFFVVAE